MRREVEDVPELLQHIQSRLAVKEAARTSLLSKSWLHAWSTIPTLRIHVLKNPKRKSMKLVDVDHTLIRYLHDNTPIEKFELVIDIENQESASHAEKWIRPVATKTCLKEFSLSVMLYGAPFRLPNEILSGLNLTKIRVSSRLKIHSVVWMTTTTTTTTTPPIDVIKCLSLRELHLDGVCISEEALNHILSSCTFLEKIELLHSCEGFKTIKVKNLDRLYELRISFGNTNNGYRHSTSTTALEISDVPNLGVFSCNLHFPFKSHSISLGSSVTQLMFGGVVITDNASLDIIKSGFPFLESLTLDDMSSWMLKSFRFTSASIKRLTLQLCPCTLIDIQVHAPKLLFFRFDGSALPNLCIPVSSTLEQINISLRLHLAVDAYFFLKMREALALSHEAEIRITTFNSKPLLDVDMDELRTRLLSPPATNVQKLSFETWKDECLWERSPFFDAILEICHPKLVFAQPDMQFSHSNHFCRLMLREVLEKKTTTTPLYWPHYLKHVQIRQSPYQTWKTLTNSHRSFLDGSAPDVYMYFKLTWC
ncbi:F-box/LRR-repeat protein At5g02910 [Lactuca sativa]|uniref:F-box/LRR-repeat protein At5g02910 n=1 Tax=Lactuca sativa TaxID=4236 RepID=UPI000CC59685|nr:F-box/LRR-repeat protein At5g02910 [Lactuca sativa]